MIQGQVFYANLTELPFFGFNVIFGMDWLTQDKANIDFKLKRVTLLSNKDREIVVDGEKAQFMFNMVLMLRQKICWEKAAKPISLL